MCSSRWRRRCCACSRNMPARLLRHTTARAIREVCQATPLLPPYRRVRMRNRCYSRLLLHALQPETLLLNDLCPEMRECICDLLPAGEPLPHKPLLYDDKVELYGAKVPLEKAKVPLYGTPLISPAVSFLPCDAETLDFPQGTDLITSCSTLQWFADTERFFTRCHHFLSDGGILAFSTFGKRNMQEIHTLTGHDWSTSRSKN